MAFSVATAGEVKERARITSKDGSTGTSNPTAMLTVNGNVDMTGDFTVGGPDATGNKVATIKTSSGDASFSVISESNGDARISVTSKGVANEAKLTIEAGANNDALLSLVEGTNAFNLVNRGAEDRLVLSDGTHDIMTMARGTGDMLVRGDLTVGGNTGARTRRSSRPTAPRRSRSCRGRGGLNTVKTNSSTHDASLFLVRGPALELVNDIDDDFKIFIRTPALLLQGPQVTPTSRATSV